VPEAAARIEAVRRHVAAACERTGRDPDAVRVVAVTKYAADEVVDELVAAGVRDLGENQAQQLRDRAPRHPEVRWHAIGPLQRNKVRYVADLAHAFHALERVDVASALSARRLAGDRQPLECFVQVNLAGEPTKAGVAPDALGSLLEALAGERLDGIAVVGLMAMPPLARHPEESRPWFRQLAELAAVHGLAGLSMGTSVDFEVAVEEGATAVRVGGALVGS
jgi:pyridoxal phosphate enzyme (YggS family)